MIRVIIPLTRQLEFPPAETGTGRPQPSCSYRDVDMTKCIARAAPILLMVPLLFTFTVPHNATGGTYNAQGSSLDSEDVSSAPALQWIYTTDGYGFGADVRQTTDGGYILVGSTLGNPDVWLVKTDADGHEIWSRTFAGDGSEYGSSVRQTADGGYIIAGEIGTPYVPIKGQTTSSNSAGTDTESQGTETGDADIWLIKTDSDGEEIWSQRFGGEEEEESRSVCQTSDNGYIIVGHITTREEFISEVSVNGTVEDITLEIIQPGGAAIWLIKTDVNGNEIWNKTFSGNSYDYSSEVRQTAGGGYIIVGRTSSYGAGKRDVWLIKTDANGNEIWNKTFGGSANDTGQSVSQTTDSGYIITGYTTSYGVGEEDLWLIKTDHDGNLIWSKTFGGADDDFGTSVCQTASGGYIVAGYTKSFSDRLSDVWLIKTDADGNMTWHQTFDADGNEYGSSVIQTADWGYLVAGQSSSRMMLLKYQPDSVEVGIPLKQVDDLTPGLMPSLATWLLVGGIAAAAFSIIAYVFWRNRHRP